MSPTEQKIMAAIVAAAAIYFLHDRLSLLLAIFAFAAVIWFVLKNRT